MTQVSRARIAAPLRMQIVQELRTAILRGQFKPGERLVEAPLCQRFEVSRTVIREALRQLETEGLVTTVANRGPTVTELTVSTAHSLFEVRAALEALAGQLFAERASDKQCKQLEKSFAKVKVALGKSNVEARLAAKDGYYDALIDGAGNDIIGTTLRGIHARVQMLRGLSLSALGRTHETIAELDRITTAAAISRDPEEARRACEDHVRQSEKVALAALEELYAANAT